MSAPHGATTSTEFATLTPARREALADLLDKIAWSATHAAQSTELYPGERSAQCAHEAACWGWVGDAFRRFTSG